jgi:O-antigen/teichoic acid export membrane protein
MLGQLKRVRQRGFVRSVSVLAGGTAFGQAVMVLALPVLTRLYTPRDLSILAVYAALLGIISIAACLRFDIAVPLPEADTDGANLLAAALGSASVVSLLLGIVCAAVPQRIAAALNAPDLAQYLWLLPIGVFFTSWSSGLQYWATRKKAFARIARTRVEQSVGGVGVQIGLGWLDLKPIGLIIGQVISGGAGVVGLGRRALMTDRLALKSVNVKEVRRLIKLYDRFPKFSTVDSLANVASLQLPVLLIAAQAPRAEAGFVLLAMRVMQAPTALIGGAIAQVFLSRAAQEDRGGSLAGFTKNVLNALVKLGIGPLLLCGLLAPDLFPVVFGPQWRRAGDLVLWMTPWFALQFLVSPVSMVVHVKNKQHVALTLNLLGLLIRAAPMGLASYYGYRDVLPEIFALSSIVYYVCWLYYCLRIAGVTVTDIFAARDTVTVLLLWVSAAVALKLLIGTGLRGL